MSDKTKNIDAKVLELFNTVRRKQKEIGAGERVNWKTNCSFSYSGATHDRFNLQVTTDLSQLVDAFIFLQTKIEYWKDACDKLGVKVPLKWSGYAPGDWQDDIKSRVGQLQLSEKRKELKNLEARLDSLITVDQRREMELEAITKELGE